MSLRTLLYLSALFIVLSSTILSGQSLTQTVRGKIVDEDAKSPLPGANVVILDRDGAFGASSDADGSFRILNVPVGRITLAVSFIGYEDRIIPNVLVTTGKETVLEITLKESLTLMDAIEVNASKDKSEISNEMALTSARAFTVEETKRFAGSFNDPARMVSGYAGVDVDPTGNNSIIVRGNSPKGIQWRLEGIDIPNPNHFSDEGATGGPINALNSQMLSNSDFYTGAFPAEFGNALSGVFDMKLRKGNNEKREYSFTIGALGTDASLEGPFAKGKNSSYLVNYRYSTLSLLNSLGLVDFDGIPKYQDLSFKFHLPTRKFGTFSIFGVGGRSNILEEETDEEDESKVLQRGDYKANMGVAGITQYWSVGSSTYLQNSLSMSQNGSGYTGHEPDESGNMFQANDSELNKNSLKVASTLNHKFNARHNVQAGIIFTRHSFNFYNKYFDSPQQEYIVDQNTIGSASHSQGFVSWKYRPVENLSIVSGMHVQKISMNDNVSVEPRASFRWQFHPKQAITGGFGIHGRMESLTNYYSRVSGEDGSLRQLNRGLDFSKARHYILGYEKRINDNLFLKAEAYYQQLFNIPVEDDPSSSYSLINQMEGFTDRKLVNKGTGQNKGIELTLEKYFSRNYYFLLTSSFFDSKYKALDGVERNTLFNGRYVGNLLVGKEFRLNNRNGKNKVIGISTKVSSLGARRFTPIDLEKSVLQDKTVYVENEAFTQRGDNVFILNLAITYRIDNRKLSQELKLDIQNATNNAAQIGQYYNSNTDKIETFDQLPLLPVLMYTITF